MKKNICLFLIMFVAIGLFSISIASVPFAEALKDCSNYSKTGSATYEGYSYGIEITLKKTKNKCQYQEKIISGKGYQALVCNFDKFQLPYLAESVEKFNEKYKKEIAKNPIFEAKLTTNVDVFEKILQEPQYCEIISSEKKK